MTHAVRAAFETADPERAHAFLKVMYGDNSMRIRGSANDFAMRHRHVDAGSLSVATMSHSMSVEHGTDPLGGLLVLRVLAGKVEHSSGGETRRTGPGDIFLIAQPDEPHTIRWDDMRVQLTWIDLTAVGAVAGVVAPPRFRSLHPVDPVQARHWRRTVDYVVSSLHPTRDSMLSPLVIGSAVHMLAAATLMAFPNSCDEVPTRPQDAIRAAVHRAISTMESRADENLGVDDLVEAARVDAGALALAFRRHLGTTPGEYLNQIRLDQAHQDLMYADEPVEVVARRWGFLDLTRFDADYRAAYACAPAETLQAE